MYYRKNNIPINSNDDIVVEKIEFPTKKHFPIGLL